jgi:hypothetical protein
MAEYIPIKVGLLFKHGSKIFRCVRMAPNDARAYCVPGEATKRADGTYADYGSLDVSASSTVMPVEESALVVSGDGSTRKAGFAEGPLGKMLVAGTTLEALCRALGKKRANLASQIWGAKKRGYNIVSGSDGSYRLLLGDSDPLAAQ